VRRLAKKCAVAVAWLFWLIYSEDAHAIVVDGRLDETEWQQAHAYTEFRTTQPLLFDVPPYSTRALALATPAGLAVAVECAQPAELRVRGRSPRDAQLMDADAVSVLVDFDGGGSTAYEFTVSLSGSVRDGIVLQQNRRQYTWDGVWYAAALETDVGWQVELLLPWSIASMGAADNARRKIGMLVAREVKARAQLYSYPAIVSQSPSFVADFQKIEIPAFAATSFDLTPYGAVNHDQLADHTSARGGVDINWRPTPGQQLTATLNPDFGQIESDDLVVNFSAIETFRPDKRPFFTQNQQLFDLQVTSVDKLIHTRRIGAAPDIGPQASTELLGAVKYFWNSPDWELGAFAALEDDSTLSQGRTFLAARSRWKAEQGSVGYLGTYVDRPSLHRQVAVHAVDAEWLPSPGWRLTTQMITTRPSQPSDDRRSSEAGYGALAMLEFAGAARFSQTLWLKWYDQQYDTNDMGFMQRNGIRELLYASRWYHRLGYPSASRLQAMDWIMDAQLGINARDQRLPSWFRFGPFWTYRNGSYLYLNVQPTTSGVDDLSARIHDNSFLMPPQHAAQALFGSDPSRSFQYVYRLNVFREGLEQYGWQAQLAPAWSLDENLKVSAALTYAHGPAWLIWRDEADRMASHERSLLQTAFTFEWFPSVRSELRAKLQWSALRARTVAAYDIDTSRHLVRSDVIPPDFSRSELALQLRFRYQFRPMSDLYIAYSWGGLAFVNDSNRFGSLWGAALGERSAQEFMIKLTYRL
jgi:hypothetical protein